MKNNQVIFKYLKCNKKHNKYFSKDLIKRFANAYKFCDVDIKDLIKRFANAYKFCDGDINKFILLLKNAVYSYE